MKTLSMAPALFASSAANAEEWCNLQADWDVYTHGNSSDAVWIYGVFVGQTTYRWIRINDPSAGIGEANVAMALAAKLAGRGIAVYLDASQDTCANFPNWSGAIRHMRLLP